MRRRVVWLMTILLLLGVSTPAIARSAMLTEQQRVAVLDEAQQAYEDGVAILRTDPIGARQRFRSAAQRFQLLVDDGVENGRLYYNLANAHLQADALGSAILNYRRAQQLIPADPRLASNLSYARSLCRSQITTSGRRKLLDTLLIWHRQTALTKRSLLFTVFYGTFWVTLLGWLLHRHPMWKYPTLTLAALWFALGLSVAADLFRSGDRQDGVIIADQVDVRKGNGEGFQLQFEEPLFQGVEFTCLQRRADWLHIRLPDAGTGWIRADQAAFLVTSENPKPAA